jgi:hypothetical protein
MLCYEGEYEEEGPGYADNGEIETRKPGRVLLLPKTGSHTKRKKLYV